MSFENPGAAVAAPGVQGQQPNQNAAAFAVALAAALMASQCSAGPSDTSYPKEWGFVVQSHIWNML